MRTIFPLVKMHAKVALDSARRCIRVFAAYG
jgi:hypothetical protein